MIMEFTHMGYLSMSASIDETIHSKGCKTSTGPQLFTSIMALICKNYLWCPLGRYQRILPTIKSTQALLILPMEGLFVTGYKLFILSNVEDNDIKKKKFELEPPWIQSLPFDLQSMLSNTLQIWMLRMGEMSNHSRDARYGPVIHSVKWSLSCCIHLPLFLDITWSPYHAKTSTLCQGVITELAR